MNANGKALGRFFDGELWHRFTHSPLAIGAALVALMCVVAAAFAHMLAPHHPFDLATLELADALLPPPWSQSAASAGARPQRRPSKRGSRASLSGSSRGGGSCAGRGGGLGASPSTSTTVCSAGSDCALGRPLPPSSLPPDAAGWKGHSSSNSLPRRGGGGCMHSFTRGQGGCAT